VDIRDLLPLLEKLPTHGLHVSRLEPIKIQCLLRLLQSQMKAEPMHFFGKVLGVRSDYYVAFSTVVEAWPPSVRYYSQDCVVWLSLTEAPTDWAFDCSGENNELRLSYSRGRDSRCMFVIRCLPIIVLNTASSRQT
jgi:hypothetical protein